MLIHGSNFGKNILGNRSSYPEKKLDQTEPVSKLKKNADTETKENDVT